MSLVTPEPQNLSTLLNELEENGPSSLESWYFPPTSGEFMADLDNAMALTRAAYNWDAANSNFPLVIEAVLAGDNRSEEVKASSVSYLWYFRKSMIENNGPGGLVLLDLLFTIVPRAWRTLAQTAEIDLFGLRGSLELNELYPDVLRMMRDATDEEYIEAFTRLQLMYGLDVKVRSAEDLQYIRDLDENVVEITELALQMIENANSDVGMVKIPDSTMRPHLSERTSIIASCLYLAAFFQDDEIGTMYNEEVLGKAKEFGWNVNEEEGYIVGPNSKEPKLRGMFTATSAERTLRVALIDLYRAWRSEHPIPTEEEIDILVRQAIKMIGDEQDSLDILRLISTRYQVDI